MQKFIKQITHQAGQIILEKFGKVGVKYTKLDAADVVTEADLAANDYLVEQIISKYPDHGIISEERGESKTDAEYVWIIDPLDGTRNYSIGTPLFGVMVGLVWKGEMVMGAICDPTHNQLVFAEIGQGAYLNDKKIKCSETKEWEHSYGLGFTTINEKTASIYSKLINSVFQEPFWMNSFGCAAFAGIQVASGKRDWLLSLHDSVWDDAARVVVLKEAGCQVTDLAGQPWTLKSRGMIAANPHLHKKLLEVITKK
ncbi:MAG: inositol monophosphatase [Parcubacteria group bacterium]